MNFARDEHGLEALRPRAVARAGAGLQERKSAEMRTLILEATIDCLAAHGYARLSTQRVLAAANVSRGAMHHHFATKLQLVAATVEYTFYRRMQRFLADTQAAAAAGCDLIVAASEVHWQSVQTREYAAYLELAVAARTNPELNEHFLPAARRYDRVWRQEMIMAFPLWADHIHRLLLANDFAVAAHMGLLLSKPVFEGGNRLRDVQALIAGVIGQLHLAPHQAEL